MSKPWNRDSELHIEMHPDCFLRIIQNLEQIDALHRKLHLDILDNTKPAPEMQIWY